MHRLKGAMRQVAEALAVAGATREAVSLLAALAQEVLHEGWLSVAAALLVRLLQCSHPLTAVRTPLVSPPAVFVAFSGGDASSYAPAAHCGLRQLVIFAFSVEVGEALAGRCVPGRICCRQWHCPCRSL